MLVADNSHYIIKNITYDLNTVNRQILDLFNFTYLFLDRAKFKNCKFTILQHPQNVKLNISQLSILIKMVTFFKSVYLKCK